MKTVTLALILLFSAAGVSQQQPTKPHDVAMDKWHAMIPVIEKVLKEHNLHCDYPGGPWAPSIVDAADFSSTDHMSTALVDWCNGGAYFGCDPRSEHTRRQTCSLSFSERQQSGTKGGISFRQFSHALSWRKTRARKERAF